MREGTVKFGECDLFLAPCAEARRMDPDKPSCPKHGIRSVHAGKGSNSRGKWYRCGYGDFKIFLVRGLSELGEGMDLFEKDLSKSLYELGEVIAGGKKKK